jgi:hypothetical protein
MPEIATITTEPSAMPAGQLPEPAVTGHTPMSIITATEPAPAPKPEEQVARIKASKAKARVLPARVTATEPEATTAEPTAAAAPGEAEPEPEAPEQAIAAALAPAIAGALVRGCSVATLIAALSKVKPAPAAKPAANRGFYTDDMLITVLQPQKTVPGRPRLGGMARLAVYMDPNCKTYGDFLRLGAEQSITSAGRKDINWDILVGNISVAKPEAGQ